MTQLTAASHHALVSKGLMIAVIDGLECVPQADELAFHLLLALPAVVGPGRAMLPQLGIGASVKEGREQVVAKDFTHFFLHLAREVIAAQAVQVIQVLIHLMGVGERLIDVVEVVDDELGPIDELVKLLGGIAHGLTIGIIEGKHHLDVGGGSRAGQLGDQLVD